MRHGYFYDRFVGIGLRDSEQVAFFTETWHAPQQLASSAISHNFAPELIQFLRKIIGPGPQSELSVARNYKVRTSSLSGPELILRYTDLQRQILSLRSGSEYTGHREEYSELPSKEAHLREIVSGASALGVKLPDVSPFRNDSEARVRAVAGGFGLSDKSISNPDYRPTRDGFGLPGHSDTQPPIADRRL